MTDAADDFPWNNLPGGEERWKELAEATGASTLQLRFAVLRHGGASASAAARQAGYSGDSESIRRAGYAALRGLVPSKTFLSWRPSPRQKTQKLLAKNWRQKSPGFAGLVIPLCP